MEFGLGLILSFTDNATAGINNAVNSLNNLTSVAESASASMNQMASLSAVSVVADRLGSSFLNVGRGIFGMFNEVLNQTRGIGQEFEDFDVTLTALFGGAGQGAKKAQEAMSRLFDFAKNSPLEVGEVKDMIVTLQSQGINAFEKTTGSISGTRQEFLAFLTDLKSFKPEVSNERFKMAIQNYIGSGEKKMMRTAFDMGDIEQIIGHGVSKTAEGRMQDIIEMVEKKGLTNLSTKMSKTMTGVMSNVKDAFTQVYYAIASNGVFDKLKSAFMSVANTIVKIDPSRLQAMGKTIAEGLNIVVTPITKFAKFLGKLITKIIDLCETNPALVKFMMSLTAIAGALFVAIGVILKATSAFSGLSLMIIASGKNISQLATTMRTGILKMLATLLPFIATIGLLALAWKLDFAGIQTNTRMFASNVVNSLREAKNGVNGNIEDMKKIINGKGSKFEEGSFFHNITKGIMKVMVFMRALSEAWNGYTLSEDTFLKAKELGLLPLIEAVLDLKYRFGFFKKGFIDGWQEIGEKVKNVIGGIVKGAKGTFLEDMLNKLTEFLQKLGKGDTQAWYKFGESFAKFTAKAIAFWAVFKVADKVIGKLVKVALAIKSIGKVIGGLSSVGGIFTKLLPNISSGISKIFPALAKVVEKGIQMMFGSNVPGILSNLRIVFTYVMDSILGFLGGLSAPVLAVIVAIISGIVAYILTDFEDFKMRMNLIWTTIKDEALNIWNSLKEGFVRIVDSIKNAVQPVVDSFNNLKDKVVEVFTLFANSDLGRALIDLLSSIGQTIFDIVVPAFNGILRIASTVFQGLWNIVVTVFSAIVSVIGTLLSAIMDIISGILDIIVGIFTLDLGKILSGVSTIFSAILNVISSILSGVWNIIMSIFTTIANFIGSILSTVVNIVIGAFRGILTTILNVFNTAISVVKTALNFIFNIVSNILGKVSNSVRDKFDSIKNAISDKIDGAKDLVKKGIQKIKDFFNFDWKLPKLKLPHFKVKGSFSLNPPKVPSFGVDWYAKGGVFEKPSVIGVGEAGTEAVMPLQNNTEWIGTLASMIVGEIRNIVPKPSNVINSTTNNNGGSQYMTSNTNNSNISGDTDNSININSGAIQIIANNSSDKEAERLAKKIMEYIKRQQELDMMTNYA